MIEVFTSNTNKNVKYNGFVDEVFAFVEKYQLTRPELWARFVQQFRKTGDGSLS